MEEVRMMEGWSRAAFVSPMAVQLLLPLSSLSEDDDKHRSRYWDEHRTFTSHKTMEERGLSAGKSSPPADTQIAAAAAVCAL